MSTNRTAANAPPREVDRALPPFWMAALKIWLAFGMLGVLLVPPLRGVDAWFGWIPFWLVVAPAIDLLVLRRRWLVTTAGQWLILRGRQHRRRRRQAAPQRRVRRSVRRSPRRDCEIS